MRLRRAWHRSSAVIIRGIACRSPAGGASLPLRMALGLKARAPSAKPRPRGAGCPSDERQMALSSVSAVPIAEPRTPRRRTRYAARRDRLGPRPDPSNWREFRSVESPPPAQWCRGNDLAPRRSGAPQAPQAGVSCVTCPVLCADSQDVGGRPGGLPCDTEPCSQPHTKEGVADGARALRALRVAPSRRCALCEWRPRSAAPPAGCALAVLRPLRVAPSLHSGPSPAQGPTRPSLGSGRALASVVGAFAGPRGRLGRRSAPRVRCLRGRGLRRSARPSRPSLGASGEVPPYSGPSPAARSSLAATRGGTSAVRPRADCEGQGGSLFAPRC